MSGKDKENMTDGWSEYGRLVLKELERLNHGQDELKKDLDQKFNDLNDKISEFKGTEKDVDDIKAWKEKVTEVWSTTQMKQSKDEIYEQKNKWLRVGGIIVAIQIAFTILMAFKDKIF